MNIAFIGGGAMGEALAAGIIKSALVKPEEVTVSDVSAVRQALLRERYGVATTGNNLEALAHGEIVVLAVKPQTLPKVMEELVGKLRSPQARGPSSGFHTVVSIVAGARISTLTQGLRHPAVVRVMPNTPAQIGEGMSVWTATPEVPPHHREAVQAMLKALGQEIYVPDESYIDMATALSASGPAFVFLFIESLIDAGVHIGLPRDMAVPMALQTVVGSARFAQSSGRHPAELKNMVTSPGGTTAEGLLQLEAGGFRALVANAVLAAYEKARELGQNHGLHI
ncbi:MAG: pyrroline-5-carboxylate reductase [Chloroflexi bacterium]|nr:pyrroline-5-carboxylate reductase [Chloroflexota bacterium]